MAKPSTPLFFLLLLLLFLFLGQVFALDFVYNGFDGNDGLLLYGNASITAGRLVVTNASTFSLGRVLYKSKVPTKSSSSAAGAAAVISFSTSFIFSISPVSGYRSGHGLAFLFAPASGTEGATDAQHLGLFNYTTNGLPQNHVLAVEFDLFPNPEFQDIDGNHVGLDLNSLTSVTSHTAGYYPDSAASFVNLTLNSGANYQAWVDYRNLTLNITMAPAGAKKPQKPLISTSLDLSAIFEEEMYMGFCAATGALFASHRVLAWSFSNTNFSAHEALITTNLPNFVPPNPSSSRSKTFVATISATSSVVAALLIAAAFLVYGRRRQRRRANQAMEDWELEYWPHRIDYREIHSATRGFSDDNLIGTGGNGKVYRGTLPGIGEIAAKCIACGGDGAGIRQFLAEVSTLGRLTHRNLVPLRGWSKKITTTTTFNTTTTLVLIYDFMANGSLDNQIFLSGDERAESEVLGWEARVRILRDVGSALVYMHEGWAPSRVLHRDIKASNVMLDKEMRGRLGDFGLARLQTSSAVSFAAAGTTRVLGTVGYMAPELLQTGKSTVETDVYGFGVLVLETASGRRPEEEGQAALMDWVWSLMEKGEAVRALDPRVARLGGYEEKEVEQILGLGLACTHPDPRVRPSMREAVKLLDGPGENLSGPLSEGMEVHLLVSAKEKGSRWYYGSHTRAHPTFEELKDSLSSSASLSMSDIIVEGR